MHEAINKSNVLSLKFQFNKCLPQGKGLRFLRLFHSKALILNVFFKKVPLLLLVEMRIARCLQNEGVIVNCKARGLNSATVGKSLNHCGRRRKVKCKIGVEVVNVQMSSEFGQLS